MEYDSDLNPIGMGTLRVYMVICSLDMATDRHRARNVTLYKEKCTKEEVDHELEQFFFSNPGIRPDNVHAFWQSNKSYMTAERLKGATRAARD